MRMKNHFSKMGKALLGATLLSTVSITSCSDDDFHLRDYEDHAPSFLGQSLYHELQRRGNFQTVIKLIDDLEYAEVLSKTGSKTMFVAPDSAWEKFFATKPWGKSSYEELSKNQKRMLLNSSMLNNAYVMEMLANTEDGGKNLCLRQATSASAADSVTVWTPEALPRTLSPVDVDWFKSLRNAGQNVYMALDATQPMMTHFLEGQMKYKNITRQDVGLIVGQPWEDEGNRNYIYDTRVVEPDVVCLNGYFHVLDRVLVAPGNMAEMIRSNGRTNLFSKMLDRFAAPYYNERLTNQYKALNEIPADSVFELRYISNRSQNNSGVTKAPDGSSFVNPVYLPFDPGWNAYAVSSTTPKEEDMAAMFVPTDEAMSAYFLTGGGADILKRYGTHLPVEDPNNLEANLYDIPLDLMGSLIKNLMKDSFNESVPSKYLTIVNDAQDQMFVQYATVEEFKNHIDDCLVANNGVVYLINSVDAPADYAAVIAPALISENTKLVRAVAQADDNFIDGDAYASAPLKQYFSTYLKAMQSKFSFFVPTDEALSTYGYVDPVGYSKLPYGKNRTNTRFYWRFTYDGKTKGAVIPVESQAYHYDQTKGQVIPTVAGGRDGDRSKGSEYASKSTESLGTGYGVTKRSLLIEMMDQHIIVHDSDDEMGGDRKYFLSRSGAPVYIENVAQDTKVESKLGLGVGAVVKGGFQLMLDGDADEANNHQVNVLEVYDKTGTTNGYGNGMTYLVDRAMQPTMRSVYNVMTVAEGDAETTPFSEFYNLADPSYMSDQLLKAIGFVDTLETTINEQQQEKLKYHIFVRKEDNVGTTKSYCPAGGESLVRFFNNYNYTIYVPTNEQVLAARNNGLMTWEEIDTWVRTKTMDDDASNNDPDDLGYEVPLDSLDKVKAQAMVTALVNFVKYHFQDRSLFVDNVTNEGNYQTSCIDNVTGSYLFVNVNQSPSAFSLVDESGNTVNVINESGKCNILARDINYDGHSTEAVKKVNNSSYVVLHQIDHYLNFMNKEVYSNYEGCPVGRFDIWNYITDDKEGEEALQSFVAKYRLR